jgi:hypothetical protein
MIAESMAAFTSATLATGCSLIAAQVPELR